MNFTTLQPLLEKAIALRQAQDSAARAPLFDPASESAFRLFNGFAEGYPELVLDVYARTLVIHNYAEDPARQSIHH